MFDFITSDWHLFHNDIIEYCDRPFTSLKQMHSVLINKHNNVVDQKDHVWVLGDVTLKSPEHAGRVKKEVDKFNGVKHLVLGNHDRWRAHTYLHAGFTTVHSAMWLEINGIMIYMVHDPAEHAVIQHDTNAYMLCGHIHQLFSDLLPEKRIINVGVDVWNYTPVSANTIMGIIDNDINKNAQ